MGLFEATKSCMTKSFQFSGRASRSEFWKFILFVLLVSIALVIVNSAIFGPTVTQEFRISVDQTGQQNQSLGIKQSYNGGLLGSIFLVLMVLPWFAAAWRRLHDTGRAGWNCLLPFVAGVLAALVFFLTSTVVPIDASALPGGIDMPPTIRVPQSGLAFFIAWLLPVVAMITVTTWLARRSSPGPNRYGPNPHEVPQ